MNGPILKRLYSFIGRRPVLIESNRVQITFHPRTEFKVNQHIHTTPIIADVNVTGPLGALTFPIHQGLSADFSSGKMSSEVLLKFGRDEEFYKSVSKHQKKFIDSMWGTTTAHINSMITGVTEVSLLSFFIAHFRDT